MNGKYMTSVDRFYVASEQSGAYAYQLIDSRSGMTFYEVWQWNA